MTEQETTESLYYEILEVAHTATADDIKKAYRKQAKKYHPDHNKGDEKKAAECFKLIQEAYSVLKDDNKRAEYDLKLSMKSAEGQFTSTVVYTTTADPIYTYSPTYTQSFSRSAPSSPAPSSPTNFNFVPFTTASPFSMPTTFSPSPMPAAFFSSEPSFRSPQSQPQPPSYAAGVRYAYSTPSSPCVCSSPLHFAQPPLAQGLKVCIDISPYESVNGVNKEIEVICSGDCACCQGTGSVQIQDSICMQCNGQCQFTEFVGDAPVSVMCGACSGLGHIPVRMPCKVCDGDGAIVVVHSEIIQVPPGVVSGNFLVCTVETVGEEALFRLADEDSDEILGAVDLSSRSHCVLLTVEFRVVAERPFFPKAQASSAEVDMNGASGANIDVASASDNGASDYACECCAPETGACACRFEVGPIAPPCGEPLGAAYPAVGAAAR